MGRIMIRNIDAGWGQPDIPEFNGGEKLRINVNQGWRDATILAVLGDEALAEYVMPAGTITLIV